MDHLIIEDEEHICYLKEGVIYSIFKEEDTIVDLPLITKVINSRLKISGETNRPVLIDASQVKYWTRESKEYGMSKEAARYISATGIVIGSVVLKISINWALQTFKQPHPSKFFTDQDKAFTWLKQFR
jgi:hypothetical protein